MNAIERSTRPQSPADPALRFGDAAGASGAPGPADAREVFPHRALAAEAPASCEPPLCVDLDGTLIATDLLWESVAALARSNPLCLLLIPFWLLKGKAYLKAQIAERVAIDATTLPYREQVVLLLVHERQRGRRIVLATASEIRVARAVAEHVGVFDDVIATQGANNLKGTAKAKVLAERFGTDGFDYIGDALCDLPVWQASQRAYLVGGGSRLLERVRGVAPVEQIPVATSTTRSILKLIRPHQWAKNLLLFVPLILAHQLTNVSRLWDVVFAFVAFCCCASAIYVLNDLADLEADRRHPRKKRRPLASGAVSLPTGAALSVSLLVASAVIGLVAGLSTSFLGMLGLYLIVTTAYSFHLKRLAMLDVFTLAGLYAFRVLAGGVAAETAVSGWLLAFSMFFFVSLALAKRYAELSFAAADRRPQPQRRGYVLEDRDLLLSLGPAAGCAAILPLCLYVTGADVSRLYASPEMLWLVCLVVFYWISRIWLLARRGLLHEDPVIFALKDPASYISGAIVCASLVLATF